MPPKFSRTSRGASNVPERQALLDGNSDDEDFFLKLSGPSAQPGRLVRGDDRINRLQGQVDDVVDVMQDNIGRVLARGERLEDLHDKSEDLSSNADMFRSRAKSLKQQMWWKECRMRIILAVVVIVILAIIIVPIIVKLTSNNKPQNP